MGPVVLLRRRGIVRKAAEGTGQAWHLFGRCAFALLLVACGPSGVGLPRDLSRHLAVGLEPSQAADQAILEFRQEGYELAARYDTTAFTAFGLVHEDGRTRVRVVTARGWVLAVGAPSITHSRPAVRLAYAPHDFTRDGHPDLLVGAPDAARGVECLALIEVRDGRAAERAIDFEVLGGEGCLVGVQDATSEEVGDERPPALLARVYAPALSRGVVPSLELQLDGHLRPRAIRGLAEGNTAAAAFARAVENAWRLGLLGESEDAQRAAFSVADCSANGELCTLVEERIDAGWSLREPEESIEPDPIDGTSATDTSP